MKTVVATVAVDNTFFSFDTDYSYIVPISLAENAKIGSKVSVPFGRGDKTRDGIIVELAETETNELSGLKEIKSVYEKLLDDELVKLAVWLKERCFCTTYDCLKQMLPRKYGTLKGKSERMVRLLVDDEIELSKITKKQKTVCDLLLDIGSAGANEICEFCGVGISVLKNLEKSGIVEFYSKEVYRNPYENKEIADNSEILLSDEQQEAYLKNKNMLGSGKTGLLFGVTGSGKTQIYLKLIDDVIDDGKDVIVLVPEIALTPQTLSIFHRRYGDKVAVIHSGLSLGERNDEYKRIDRGIAKIVVGTRSAIFAPVHNLGLIVMDEEQEQTYKSERTPRYNAKDVAKFRAGYNKAYFLMSSATPSIETYSNALNGKYVLSTVTQRYGNAVLPNVITVDMKNEMRNGNKSPISSILLQHLTKTINNGKQAILLINRRGYNTFIACNECGHVITCPNCSISLTYHSYNNRLVCHYCGYTKKIDNICPECGSDAVRYSGFGTQRIEEELQALLPDAKILRMDADTTTAKFSHEKLLEQFGNKEYNILIGTQMVAKGLDFEDVTLVGVVNADNSLYDQNYTASERSFDLITQVVGRAGRRDSSGTAIIQTVNPQNETIDFASNQDYIGFYNNEIMLRKLMIYPPFCDIYSATFTGENENTVALCSKAFFDRLVEYNSNEYKDIKLVVLGPTQAKISKINNTYRYRLAIKCKNSQRIRQMITKILKDVNKDKLYSKVSISISLNPPDIS
ncbi:primosomal protein N' [uncultured Eubacterium sp.]|uniref:replication restart helicase PriA n=1 Tax=uncultured Eubacterium sp. TaxID=165185 RepID=UPI002630E9D4|nr:primosomal protein N' [uncultured Eubacterium sp.]